MDGTSTEEQEDALDSAYPAHINHGPQVNGLGDVDVDAVHILHFIR